MTIIKWIRRLGILSLVISVFSLLEGILGLALRLAPGMPAYENESAATAFLIFKTLISALLLLASVFYLQKRPLSVRLMLVALALNVFYALLLRLLALQTEWVSDSMRPGYAWIILHVLILMAVYRWRMVYYMSEEELTRQFGKSKEASGSMLAYTSLSALLFTTLPLLLLFLWIQATSQGHSHAESVEWYRSKLPFLLRESGRAAMFSVVSGICGLILSSKGLGKSAGAWRFLNVPLLVLSVLLILLNLWNMM